MLKMLTALACFLFIAAGSLASCASTAGSGEVRLVDQYEDVCIYGARGNVSRKAYVGDICHMAAPIGQSGIVIRDDVSLSARDLFSAIKYLRDFTEKKCEENVGREFVQCLKNEIPNYVSRTKKCIVFWYGRHLSQDLDGFPVGIVREGDGFSAPTSSCGLGLQDL
jgi:hypothetical protein